MSAVSVWTERILFSIKHSYVGRAWNRSVPGKLGFTADTGGQPASGPTRQTDNRGSSASLQLASSLRVLT